MCLSFVMIPMYENSSLLIPSQTVSKAALDEIMLLETNEIAFLAGILYLQ